MKKINIGLIGLGTVGRGVYRVLTERKNFFREKLGIDLNLLKVCEKNPFLRKKMNIDPKRFTTKYQDIVNDKNINIVIELIGGINPAQDIIIRCLKSHKHVITANKALLANCLPEIFKVARRYNSEIRFEAAVCGGIPIIKSLSEGLITNRIERIYGIINGTSNYILSRMHEEEYSFHQALTEAKKKGFAERNPALDIKGLDSAHKLSILAYLAFGEFIPQEKIFVEGITQISPLDIKCAKELGLVIKLLAITKKTDSYIEARVHPTLIPRYHPMANVSGVYNAVFIRGDLVGNLLFFGKGAGQNPATSAVMSDLVDLAQYSANVKMAYPKIAKRIKKKEDVFSKYYIRFNAIDKPGVLSKISGILAKYNISISSVTQKETKRARSVPIIMLTHLAQEKKIDMALAEIDKCNFIRGKSVKLYLEEF